MISPILEGCSEVSLQLCLFQAEQAQLLQPVFIGEVPQSLIYWFKISHCFVCFFFFPSREKLSVTGEQHCPQEHLCYLVVLLRCVVWLLVPCSAVGGVCSPTLGAGMCSIHLVPLACLRAVLLIGQFSNLQEGLQWLGL